MSEPAPVSAFVRRCQELLDAMTDQARSERHRDEARRELEALLLGNYRADPAPFDARAAAAGERE